MVLPSLILPPNNSPYKDSKRTAKMLQEGKPQGSTNSRVLVPEPLKVDIVSRVMKD